MKRFRRWLDDSPPIVETLVVFAISGAVTFVVMVALHLLFRQ